MKRIACIAAIGAISFAAPLPAAAGAADEGKYTILGHGAVSCGIWTQGRRPLLRDGPQLMREAWVLGYITAVSSWSLPLGRGAVRNVAEGTDVDGIFAWIDNYCAAHPPELLGYSIAILAGELRERWLTAHPRP
jgi:hypothetical protein